MKFLQDLRRRFTDEQAPEAPAMSAPALVSAEQPLPSTRPTNHPTTLDVGALSDVGRVRTRNEDRYLVLQTVIGSGGTALLPLGLFAVADGMGGHTGGDTASEIAMRAITAHALPALPFFSVADDGGGRPLQEILSDAVLAAHQEIQRQAKGTGMGTTITVALLIGTSIYLAHVGDTRAYVLDADGLHAITRDHTLVNRLQELGQLTAAEAHDHPQRNVLYRALGQAEELEVETYYRRLTGVSHLLLCSDGLWNLVPEAEIARVLRESPGAQSACESLVSAANMAGGEDNITVVSLGFPTLAAPPPPTQE